MVEVHTLMWRLVPEEKRDELVWSGGLGCIMWSLAKKAKSMNEYIPSSEKMKSFRHCVT